MRHFNSIEKEDLRIKQKNYTDLSRFTPIQLSPLQFEVNMRGCFNFWHLTLADNHPFSLMVE